MTFLSSLSQASRGLIRRLRIFASVRRLESLSLGSPWPSMCRYLASNVKLQHLALVLVNDCSSPQSDVADMQRLCQMDSAWVKYLTWILGLTSFTLHTARCPFRDAPSEGRDKCPTTLPLAAEVKRAFNQTHLWTEEDRKSGLVIEDSPDWYDGRIERSKNPMTRHIERHQFNPFYVQPLGACISHRFQELLRIELGVDLGSCR